MQQLKEKKEPEKPACETICPQGAPGWNGTDVIFCIIQFSV